MHMTYRISLKNKLKQSAKLNSVRLQQNNVKIGLVLVNA